MNIKEGRNRIRQSDHSCLVSTAARRFVCLLLTFAAVTAIYAMLTPCTFASSNTPADVSIPVRYEVTHDITVNSDFILTAKDGAPMPEGSEDGAKTVTLHESGKVYFGTIRFTRPDIYEYSLHKETENIDGLTADGSVYRIRVQITYDGKVTLVMNKEGEEAKTDEILFTDAIIGDVYDDPPVKKIVEGDDAPKREKFRFIMSAVSAKRIAADGTVTDEDIMTASEMPMPEGSFMGRKTLKLKAGQEDEFGIVHFSEVGEYTYEIYEDDTGKQGYKYDQTVYTVKYTVTVNNGKWKSERHIYDKDGSEVNIATFVFTNSYTRPAGGLIRTGDASNLPILITMLTAATAVLAMLAGDRRRSRR